MHRQGRSGRGDDLAPGRAAVQGAGLDAISREAILASARGAVHYGLRPNAPYAGYVCCMHKKSPRTDGPSEKKQAVMHHFGPMA